MKLSLIVAHSTNGAIGYKGKLPWKCSNDMAYFRKTTIGPGENANACIMGRNTWESIPGTHKLPGRVVIVISTILADIPNGYVARSLEQALALAKMLECKDAFIIGGRALFEEYEQCDELHMTHIHKEVKDADCFFSPKIDTTRWYIADTDVHDDCTVYRWVKRQ